MSDSSGFARLRRPVRAVTAGLLLASCASYPERTAEAFHDFRSGQLEAARVAYADPETTGSAFLQGAEAGTVALAQGLWDEALTHFAAAAEEVRELEDRALVSASELGEGLATWVINDTLAPYQGEGFERVYLHCLMGLAYLAQGRPEDFLVEARRSNLLLEREEELYEKEYRAGGLGHFLSAVAYELIGEPGEACIDYERMVDKDLGTELAGRALVRLTRELHRADDAERWEERFGTDYERPPDAASIVVVAGVGCGPYKVEGGLTLPTSEGLFQMAVAQYASRPQSPQSPQPIDQLVLAVAGPGGSTRVETTRLEDVGAVARENLADRLAWQAAKSIARGALKLALRKNLADDHGIAGAIAGDLFTLFTERADLRAWQTLPDAWHAARVFVPAGDWTLALEAPGGSGGQRAELGTFALDQGETMFVLARTVDQRIHAHAVGGRPLVSAASP